jgi:serine phosphatase RsbU (regulator of sigma subunit)
VPGTDDHLLRLAALVDRQRQEMDRLRAGVNAQTIIATATGVLMERLGCSAADAMTQLTRLAEATGVPAAEMAATVVATEPPPEPVTVGPGVSAIGAAGTAADGAEFAATLARQVAPRGPDTVAIWLLGADGALELLGESGLSGADAARWRYLPAQLDCLAQRVAHGAGDQWWAGGRPADLSEMPVTGAPDAARAALALRERNGRLLGVLELRWPAGAVAADGVREPLGALAAGWARVLDTRLALGDLAAAQPRQGLFSLFDSIADSVLVARALRDTSGSVTDFAIDHISPGFLDPAGRPVSQIAGLTLLEAYPLATAGHGLFARALSVVEDGQPQHIPGPLVEPVPIADLRAARFFDGVIFSWRGFGEAGSLTDLLDHVQRLGRLGAWEENLVTGAVRWTDPVFEIFGLAPGAGSPIRLAELHSYVTAADKGVVRRLGRDLRAGRDALSTTFRIVRPDDSTVRQIRVFAEPVTDATGSVVALRGAFQDVSAHYLTQVALDVTRDQLADTEQRAAEEHKLALRLQRAILPPEEHPVEAAGIDVAVRYRPAGRGHLVGGDWYDTLVLPTGDVLLVVGDVAGHGIEAVTGMVAARNALRGLAVTGAGPGELLRLLNLTLCTLVDGVIGTVVCGVYRPGAGDLRWARAGHLPPLLIRDGAADMLSLPGGVLLGMDPSASYEEISEPLRQGDTLVLFTDGLIERRDESISDALTEFAANASGLCGPDGAGPDGAGSADLCADRLLASATSDTDDDACLVAVRILLALGRERSPAGRGRRSGRGLDGPVVYGRRLGGDPVPGVPRPGPVHGGDAVRLHQQRVGEQLPDPLRQQGRPPRRDDDAGRAVDDGVDVAAGGRRHDRLSAGHGLERGDARRLVCARAHHQVRRTQQRRQFAPADPAGEYHPVGDPQAPGHRGEPAVRGVLGQPVAGRPAHDHQLGVGHLGKRAEQRLQRLPLGQVGGGEQPRPSGTRRGGAFGGERVGVNPPGDAAHRSARHAHPGQAGHDLGACRHDRVGAAADGPLEAKPRWRLGRIVVPLLGDAERAERLHHRDAEAAGSGQRGEPAGPADRVHHVRVVPQQALPQRLAERGHVSEQAGLRRGGNRKVLDPKPAAELGLTRRLGATRIRRVDGYVVPLPGKRGGELVQHRVVGTRARAGSRVQGGGMLRNYGDLHGECLLNDFHHGVSPGEAGRVVPGPHAPRHSMSRTACLRRRHH